MFLIAGKLNEVRSEEIDGYIEEDEFEYYKEEILYILNCEMSENICGSFDIL